jgi:phthalate 4,5-cis-dihydrodiol dehydrogenase
MQSARDEIERIFASRDVERARAYAETFWGSGVFGSYEAAAADPRVEALYLCTPHHLHREHVALAAQAGKHILVEKPIARTLAEPRR